MNDITHDAVTEFHADIAQRKSELLKQVLHAEYVSGAFSGQDQDWLEWLTEDEKAALLRKIGRAAVGRILMGEALREVMALIFAAVDKCARGHVEQLERNWGPSLAPGGSEE
jgi:hypothetical protein